MRALMIAAIAAFSSVPATAQDGNIVSFLDFALECRSNDPGAPMVGFCPALVLDEWREFSNHTDVACDYGAFWTVADYLFAEGGEPFLTQGWQKSVQQIIAESGVCRVDPSRAN